jgi:hypothetical protein
MPPSLKDCVPQVGNSALPYAMGPIYTQQFSVALAFFWNVSANAPANRILLLKSRHCD